MNSTTYPSVNLKLNSNTIPHKFIVNDQPKLTLPKCRLGARMHSFVYLSCNAAKREMKILIQQQEIDESCSFFQSIHSFSDYIIKQCD